MDDVFNVILLSYGKDSLASFGACEKLGIPIHGAVHAEVWATDTIPADLPPMVEFKAKADKIIKDRWGIDVKHVCAMWGGGYRTHTREPSTELLAQKGQGQGQGNTTPNATLQEKKLSTDSQSQLELGAIQDLNVKHSIGQRKTYEQLFYKTYQKGKRGGQIQGFPISTTRGNFCTSLKTDIRISDSQGELVQQPKNASTKFSSLYESEVVQLLGIASDEPERIERHQGKQGIRLPLVEAGWNEEYCKQWCIDNDLLSPIYTDECTRGGCWFCHNQSVNQLRNLRRDYPDLWQLLLKWDNDSPTTFKTDGHTVHDYDRRFQAEDDGFIDKNAPFYWKNLEMQQFNIFHYLSEK